MSIGLSYPPWYATRTITARDAFLSIVASNRLEETYLETFTCIFEHQEDACWQWAVSRANVRRYFNDQTDSHVTRFRPLFRAGLIVLVGRKHCEYTGRLVQGWRIAVPGTVPYVPPLVGPAVIVSRSAGQLDRLSVAFPATPQLLPREVVLREQLRRLAGAMRSRLRTALDAEAPE